MAKQRLPQPELRPVVGPLRPTIPLIDGYVRPGAPGIWKQRDLTWNQAIAPLAEGLAGFAQQKRDDDMVRAQAWAKGHGDVVDEIAGKIQDKERTIPELKELLREYAKEHPEFEASNPAFQIMLLDMAGKRGAWRANESLRARMAEFTVMVNEEGEVVPEVDLRAEIDTAYGAEQEKPAIAGSIYATAAFDAERENLSQRLIAEVEAARSQERSRVGRKWALQEVQRHLDGIFGEPDLSVMGAKIGELEGVIEEHRSNGVLAISDLVVEAIRIKAEEIAIDPDLAEEAVAFVGQSGNLTVDGQRLNANPSIRAELTAMQASLEEGAVKRQDRDRERENALRGDMIAEASSRAYLAALAAAEAGADPVRAAETEIRSWTGTEDYALEFGALDDDEVAGLALREAARVAGAVENQESEEFDQAYTAARLRGASDRELKGMIADALEQGITGGQAAGRKLTELEGSDEFGDALTKHRGWQRFQRSVGLAGSEPGTRVPPGTGQREAQRFGQLQRDIETLFMDLVDGFRVGDGENAPDAAQAIDRALADPRLVALQAQYRDGLTELFEGRENVLMRVNEALAIGDYDLARKIRAEEGGKLTDEERSQVTASLITQPQKQDTVFERNLGQARRQLSIDIAAALKDVATQEQIQQAQLVWEGRLTQRALAAGREMAPKLRGEDLIRTFREKAAGIELEIMEELSPGFKRPENEAEVRAANVFPDVRQGVQAAWTSDASRVDAMATIDPTQFRLMTIPEEAYLLGDDVGETHALTLSTPESRLQDYRREWFGHVLRQNRLDRPQAYVGLYSGDYIPWQAVMNGRQILTGYVTDAQDLRNMGIQAPGVARGQVVSKASFPLLKEKLTALGIENVELVESPRLPSMGYLKITFDLDLTQALFTPYGPRYFDSLEEMNTVLADETTAKPFLKRLGMPVGTADELEASRKAFRELQVFSIEHLKLEAPYTPPAFRPRRN